MEKVTWKHYPRYEFVCPGCGKKVAFPLSKRGQKFCSRSCRGLAAKVEIACATCGKKKTRWRGALGTLSYCSQRCYLASTQAGQHPIVGRSGAEHPAWKGGRRRQSEGYTLVYAPGHPRAHQNAVLEHVLVVEKHLGRYLEAGEEVHHLNGQRDDNRIENLELAASHREHILSHHKAGSARRTGPR